MAQFDLIFLKGWGYWSAALLDNSDAMWPTGNTADGGYSCFSELILHQNMGPSVFIQSSESVFSGLNILLDVI